MIVILSKDFGFVTKLRCLMHTNIHNANTNYTSVQIKLLTLIWFCQTCKHFPDTSQKFLWQGPFAITAWLGPSACLDCLWQKPCARPFFLENILITSPFFGSGKYLYNVPFFRLLWMYLLVLAKNLLILLNDMDLTSFNKSAIPWEKEFRLDGYKIMLVHMTRYDMNHACACLNFLAVTFLPSSE